MSLENLQRVMQAYRKNRNSRVELKLHSSGCGTLLLDDSWRRKGDVCYIELHTWTNWEEFYRIFGDDEKIKTIVEKTSLPGKLTSGWEYVNSADSKDKAVFDSRGEPTIVDTPEGVTWIRVGPANKGELDWNYR